MTGFPETSHSDALLICDEKMTSRRTRAGLRG